MCLIRYVVPALAVAMRGKPLDPEPVPLATSVKFHRSLAYFLPVALRYDSGHAAALPKPTNGPGDFLALTRSDGFVELPPQTEAFPAGFVANYYRW